MPFAATPNAQIGSVTIVKNRLIKRFFLLLMRGGRYSSLYRSSSSLSNGVNAFISYVFCKWSGLSERLTSLLFMGDNPDQYVNFALSYFFILLFMETINHSEAVKLLSSKGISTKCPMCGKEEFKGIREEEFQLVSFSHPQNGVIDVRETTILPCITVNCLHCGFLAQFSLADLRR